MKKRYKILLSLAALLLVFIVYFMYVIHVPEPDVDETFYEKVVIDEPSRGFYRYGNNWFRKSESGLYELYVEGSPYERGVINGKLSRQLVINQERHFTDKISEMIPSRVYVNFLKYFVAWFNRDLDENIPEEYMQEIYGVSRSASDEFSFIGPGYYRMLNYHAAHDIGHFLQELHMVGCTSFASWDGDKADSSLIVGRNFDFFVGDKFAEEKIIAFINPDQGHKFMMVTWGGMIGAVSGMNEAGLTVTINAASGPMPFNTATPISIVAREVLQYASTIDEAYAIIDKRRTFVGQSFLIASAADNKAVVIEKTVSETALFDPGTTMVYCANHYQSDRLKNAESNIIHQDETSTLYRYKRIEHLVTEAEKLTPAKVAEILRDRKGPAGEEIGLGNERALNQLQGHHSIIFKPEECLVWVSTAPWQLGEYVCYDLNAVFAGAASMATDSEINVDSLTIPEDPFMNTEAFRRYLIFRGLRPELERSIRKGIKNDTLPVAIVGSNPEYYLAYELAGDYYNTQKRYSEARDYYDKALLKSIPWKADSVSIVKKREKVSSHLN